MLNDATCFKNVYIVCGHTDLRKEIDSLASIIVDRTDLRPFVPDTLYLFCGRQKNKIKGLVWERDGYLLLYKRLSNGYFQWPRHAEDVKHLTQEQFLDLMEGFEIERKTTIHEVNPEYVA